MHNIMPLSFKPFMSRTAAQKFELGHIGKVPALRPPLRVSITHTLHGRGTGLRDKVCIGGGIAVRGLRAWRALIMGAPKAQASLTPFNSLLRPVCPCSGVHLRQPTS